MKEILPFIEIVVAVVLITLILLQQKGSGLGSAFGGGDGAQYTTRRGIQQKLHVFTIVLATTFILLALLNLIL